MEQKQFMSIISIKFQSIQGPFSYDVHNLKKRGSELGITNPNPKYLGI